MKKHHDAALIQALGGITKVAEMLNLKAGGPQRVHNWTTRGIPPKVKLERPDLFLASHEALTVRRKKTTA